MLTKENKDFIKYLDKVHNLNQENTMPHKNKPAKKTNTSKPTKKKPMRKMATKVTKKRGYGY